MSDNLPNQNNSPSPWEVTPPQTPTSNPSNPSIPPNPPQPPPNGNNTVDPVQSWITQHEQRDSSGKMDSKAYK